jgi:ribosomal protein S18 acetylase RimI-like enzyme
MAAAATIRSLTLADAEACDEIIRALPDWFGLEVGIVDCAAAVRSQDGFVAERADGSVGGFLTWVRHFPETAEITWLAVAPEAHRQGLGRALVTALSERLTLEGARLLLVKTLSERGDSEHYDRTRAFYLATGFLPLQEMPDLWDEENPALLLVRPLG